MKDTSVISPNGEKSILGKDNVSGESRAITVNPDGSLVSGGGSVGGSQSVYSNDAADFTVTPTVGAKDIVLSAFPTTQLSDMLTSIGVAMFAKASIFKFDAAGKKTTLPLTTVAWNDTTKTLTLSDMNAPFATGDVVNVSIPGPVKWYDKLDKNNDHVTNHPIGLQSVTLSVSGLVMTGAGRVRGVIINSISGGSVLIYDNTGPSGTVKCPATIFPAVGTYELFNIECTTGAYIVISGTVSATFLYENT